METDLLAEYNQDWDSVTSWDQASNNVGRSKLLKFVAVVSVLTKAGL